MQNAKSSRNLIYQKNTLSRFDSEKTYSMHPLSVTATSY